MPNPPPSLRPMADFDPSEPAILHDSRTDCIVTWTGEDVATYREEAIARPDGTVEWSGYIFDGCATCWADRTSRRWGESTGNYILDKYE